MTENTIEHEKAYYDQRWGTRSMRLTSEEALRFSKIYWSMIFVLMDMGHVVGGQPAEGLRICDLGCGAGWLSQHLTNFGAVTGVDYSAEGVQRAQKMFPEAEFVVGDVRTFRSETPFDVVVSSEVLEHVLEKEAFFATLRALVRPGGYAVLTCPNRKVQKHFAAGLPSHQPIEDWPTPQRIRSLAAANGFSRLHYETFRFGYAKVGPARYLESVKLKNAIKQLNLTAYWEAFLAAREVGIYQLLIARRDG